jgi:hypothetical protein
LAGDKDTNPGMVRFLTTRVTESFARKLMPESTSGLDSVVLFFFQIPEFSEIYSAKKGNVYNMLWVLVFGFATLNILGLVLRRFEPRRSGLNFGELLAIGVVVVSVVLLGLEMLNVFHILPIRLSPH